VSAKPILLEARGVHYAYGAGVEAVRAASLVIEPGSFCALVGANGSGKSTLLRLLAGILVPSRGEILLEGSPLPEIDRRRLATRISYVPQSQSTVFPFTALEVVLTGRSPYTSRFRFESDADREVARQALATVDALALESRPVTELSVGERQLVAVARALAQDADCMLLDEPSSSLDLKHRARLIAVLRQLREERGLTTLIVTHDLQLLDPGFDLLYALRAGEIVAEGSPASVLQESRLMEIYGDEHVRSRRIDGRTFIWSEW
jgi:ABC-type cobalamin/Fe3+-siderophores transport system ATPase subunit